MVLVLVVAVLVVGAVAALDLLLTLAVIRRLREHTAALARMTPQRPALPEPGTVLPPFTATAEGGRIVSPDQVTGPTVVGVFSTSCAACHERLPEFVALAAGLPVERVVAVVAGDPAEDDGMSEALRPVATLVPEPMNGAILSALQTAAFPSFYLIDRVDDRAVIKAAAHAPGGLPEVVRA
jgi:hypothetical protein